MFLNNNLYSLLVRFGLTAALLGAMCSANAAAPASATITYNLFRNGIQLGVITEQFNVKDGVYRATSEAHATGLFALIQREPVRYVSNGEQLLWEIFRNAHSGIGDLEICPSGGRNYQVFEGGGMVMPCLV